MTSEAIRAVDIDIHDRPEGATRLIVPRPFDHWGQALRRFEVDGVDAVSEIGAENSEMRAYLITPKAGAIPRVRYEVGFLDRPAPDWVWRVQRNRHTIAAPSLIDAAQRLAEGASSQKTALRRLIEDAVAIFTYGHVDERFTDGCDAVPMLCGTTRGSCVDINTYLLAAANSLGIRSQYIAGYWFHPEKTATDDMHCWLAFAPDGELEFWDVAHGLKWAETLNARVAPGLNPAGGRRVAMSCGRGLEFDTGFGLVEISHFSEPCWIGEVDGVAAKLARPTLTIRVEDPDGIRTQLPETAETAKEAAA